MPHLSREERGPVFICYDQEPLIPGFNRPVFEEIKRRYAGPFILLNTEKDSDAKKVILSEHGFIDCYYFYHGFAAADWFRGHNYDYSTALPADRTIKKSFVSFNRLTSNERVYRSLFVSKLVENNLLDDGHVSYSKICPATNLHYRNSLIESPLIPNNIALACIRNLDTIDHELRIDSPPSDYIPNRSFDAYSHALEESLFFMVTETCYWERKKHLTEKIFKPVVNRMPFMLLGPAHNLKYFKSYGFETFGNWVDESYDEIEDNFERINAVIENIKSIKGRDHKKMLKSMSDTLEYNFEHFNSYKFVDRLWNELKCNIKQAIVEAYAQRQFQPFLEI